MNLKLQLVHYDIKEVVNVKLGCLVCHRHKVTPLHEIFAFLHFC